MISLNTELKKPKYSELSSTDILTLLPEQVDKIGQIRGDKKLDLLTLVITGDLTNRLDGKINLSDDDLGMSSVMASLCRDTARIVRDALNPELILTDLYLINLGLPEIKIVFDAALSFGLITDVEHSVLLTLAIYKDGQDFTGVTLAQINQTMNRYTEKEVLNYTQGKSVKITLIDDLPENCIATTWVKDVGYIDENFGKVSHLKVGSSQYKLKCDSKKANGNLFVRIPLENFKFTVEVI